MRVAVPSGKTVPSVCFAPVQNQLDSNSCQLLNSTKFTDTDFLLQHPRNLQITELKKKKKCFWHNFHKKLIVFKFWRGVRLSPPLSSSSLPHVPFYVHPFIIMQQLLSYGCVRDSFSPQSCLKHQRNKDSPGDRTGSIALEATSFPTAVLWYRSTHIILFFLYLSKQNVPCAPDVLKISVVTKPIHCSVFRRRAEMQWNLQRQGIGPSVLVPSFL